MTSSHDQDTILHSSLSARSSLTMLDEETISPETWKKMDAQPLFGDKKSNMIREGMTQNSRFWVIYFATLSAVLSCLSCLVAGRLLWEYLSHPAYHRLSVTDAPMLTCGNTEEEARAHGCKLDPMVYSFTPTACFNESHSLSFFYSESWPFWSDFNRTTPISAGEILEATHAGFYSSWEFHGAHCQYLLTRNLQVLPHGGPLNEYMLDEAHNDHCFEEVRKPSDMRKHVKVGIHFSDCYLTDS